MTKKIEEDGILDTPVEDQEVEVVAADIQSEQDTSVLSEEAVTVSEQPKAEKKKCFLANISLDNWVAICSLLSIVLQFFAIFLVGVSNSYVVYQVFAYLGYMSVIAASVVYVVQMIRTKIIAFTPQLVLLILAIFMTKPLGVIY